MRVAVNFVSYGELWFWPSGAPTCPYWFWPQQRTRPTAGRPQVCAAPTLTASTSAFQSTATGGETGEVEPEPSCPARFTPQHRSPVAERAHECATPATTSNAGSPSVASLTSTGPGSVAFNTPSCFPWFEPQQCTLPSGLVTAQVWSSPADAWDRGQSSGTESTGVE
ncbi:MAG: hypothetical protein U0263_23335 [Polyangiaceae bacterium]